MEDCVITTEVHDQLQAENKRLREALEAVAVVPTHDPVWLRANAHVLLENLIVEAREALATPA
jgi:hypothetical protein